MADVAFIEDILDDSSLMHYGIKGMKWGVRRTPEQLGRSGLWDSYKSRKRFNKIQRETKRHFKNFSKRYNKAAKKYKEDYGEKPQVDDKEARAIRKLTNKYYKISAAKDLSYGDEYAKYAKAEWKIEKAVNKRIARYAKETGIHLNLTGDISYATDKDGKLTYMSREECIYAELAHQTPQEHADWYNDIYSKKLK